jgi:GNAT superfamily N-acetyltransferase
VLTGYEFLKNEATMAFTIRQATPRDAATVVEFNQLLAHESEGKTLDLALLGPGVERALADPAKAVYFLAEEQGRVLGQLSYTTEWSDWRNGWIWWIQSVYVRPEARRRGVFRSLYAHLRTIAKEDPEVIGIRLYVERDNEKAHHTYLGMGMEWTSYLVMQEYPL